MFSLGSTDIERFGVRLVRGLSGFRCVHHEGVAGVGRQESSPRCIGAYVMVCCRDSQTVFDEYYCDLPAAKIWVACLLDCFSEGLVILFQDCFSFLRGCFFDVHYYCGFYVAFGAGEEGVCSFWGQGG